MRSGVAETQSQIAEWNEKILRKAHSHVSAKLSSSRSFLRPTVLVGLRSLVRLPSSSSELSFPVFKLVTKYLSAEKKPRFYENLTEHLYHGHRSAASLRCITLAPDNRQTTLKRGSIIVAFINTSTNSCRSTEK